MLPLSLLLLLSLSSRATGFWVTVIGGDGTNSSLLYVYYRSPANSTACRDLAKTATGPSCTANFRYCEGKEAALFFWTASGTCGFALEDGAVAPSAPYALGLGRSNCFASNISFNPMEGPGLSVVLDGGNPHDGFVSTSAFLYFPSEAACDKARDR